MTFQFKDIIKAVGTGPKRNRDLSKEEIFFTIQSIFQRDFSDPRIAAFLISWRLKGESHDELRYAYEYICKSIKYTNIDKNSVFIGYPFDGKNKNPYLLLLASKYLKDINLSITGDDMVPAKNGCTTKDIQSNCNLNKNIKYFDRKNYLKELSNLSAIRNEIVVRSAFNAIEKLINPSKSKYAIVGFTHGAYKDFYKSLKTLGGFERLVVIKGGDEGTPDISKSCKISVIDQHEEFGIKLNLEEFGIDSISTKDIKSKEEILHLMQNNDIDPNLLKLNAALVLIASKKFDDIKKAYQSL